MIKRRSIFPVTRIALGICAITLCAAAARAQSAPSTAQQAEQALLAAAGSGDAAAAGNLLDAEFEWTTPAGVSHKRDETLANLSALGTNTRGETSVQFYPYDQLVVTTGVRPTSRFLRVWVQRPQGWRLFAMIHVPIVTGTPPPFSVATGDKLPDCDNPCRTIPFNPATPAQREMLDTFKLLKMDEWHPNPDEWAPYVLDDAYYFTSAAAMSKADRVNRLAQLRQTGVASTPGDPVLFMRIAEFGQSAVMFARHAPFRGGKPFYSVRVWSFQEGKWRFANSAQTTIEAAAPLPAVQ